MFTSNFFHFYSGTTEEEIVNIFEQATSKMTESTQIVEGGEGNRPFRSSIFVFLDEINTCAHMGLM